MELHLVGDCCSRPLTYIGFHICTHHRCFLVNFIFLKMENEKKIQILILLKSQEHFNRGICLLFRADLFFFSSFYALIFWLLHGND
jgi:hypothetical protein